MGWYISLEWKKLLVIIMVEIIAFFNHDWNNDLFYVQYVAI